MIEHIQRWVAPTAYELLPPRMASPEATAMLLAIALQESRCAHRRQVRGPARGFWQFELAGVSGVHSHPSSRLHLEAALSSLCYSAAAPTSYLHVALEHNDVLACVFARLLLWTLPGGLPARDEPDRGWDQYVSAWRPGKPHPETWAAHYARAWEQLR